MTAVILRLAYSTRDLLAVQADMRALALEMRREQRHGWVLGSADSMTDHDGTLVMFVPHAQRYIARAVIEALIRGR